jgi:gamma-glutamyltranspeptidase/glutathione hydrolase
MSQVNATRLGPLVGLAIVVGLLATPPGTGLAASGPPLESSRGAVASDDPAASRVGADVLSDGGNATDAAIATALALGVSNPASSGIGGGGFALVWDAATRTLRVYDFREVAPAALDPSDFLVDGVLDPQRSRLGGLAVGVPGEIRGLAMMSKQHGRLSWRRLVNPAAALARDGKPASWFFTRASGEVLKMLPDQPAFAPLRALLGGDHPRRWNDWVTRPALAATLLALAADPDAFYRGPIADDIVATVTAAGGVLTPEDLAAYAPVERTPLWGDWHGVRLATMPMPSSGGVVLLEALGILDRTGIDLVALGAGSAAADHVIAEALKHGFADRARLMGDTGAGRAAASVLLDDARLRRLAARVKLDRTQPTATYGEMPGGAAPPPAATGKPPPEKRGGTSHVCVIDAEGNAVSLTTTVNGYFGSKLVTAGGVVLNNQMDDFAIDLTVANGFGLVQSAANLVGPGKRPLSSMSPVLVFEGDQVVGCVGGSGGPRIISNTLQGILSVWLFGLDPRAAVEAPRVHHQWTPDVLVVDPELSLDTRKALEARGHVVVVNGSPTAVQILRRRPDGVIEAASDPRKNGAPAAPAP